MTNKTDDILAYFNELFPDVSCELNYENDIQLLIAVVLSAQTTDKSVNNVTMELYKNYSTCEELSNLTVFELKEYIRKLGLFETKSKNVYNLLQIVKNEYNCIVPSNYDSLVKLPGVGRKTANVMLAEYFKVPAIAVDTHVERVSKRLKLAYNNDSVLQVEKKLMRKFPRSTWIKLHHQFIHFGRYFCKAQNPNCEECKLTEYCRYKK